MSARYRKKENEIIFLQYFTENKMTISVCKRFTQPCLTLILSTYLKLKTQQLTQHGFFQDPLITLCEDFVYDLSSYTKNQKSIFLLQQEQALC